MVERIIVLRNSKRNCTDVAIRSRPFTSIGLIREAEGVLLNCSSYGAYIETIVRYDIGTILIVRMVSYQFTPATLPDNVYWPRSIFLAEVRWQNKIVDNPTLRFGTGLRYID